MSLIIKNFGELALKVCPTTKFICAKAILEEYNKTADKKRLMKKLNQHMKGPAFFKSVIADFDKVAIDNKIDEKMLAGPENGPAISSEEMSVSQYYTNIPEQTKFNYMVRQDFTMNGNAKTIKSILVHPNTAIKVAIWMSPVFGYGLISHIESVSDDVLLYIDGTVDMSFPDKTIRNNMEEIISDRLSLEYDGKREVYVCDRHRIDVLTNEYIIEVKKYQCRIKALGQVLYYQSGYTGLKLWIHLFNHDNARDIAFERTCNMNNIKLTYE